jgi:hypothetical protein
VLKKLGIIVLLLSASVYADNFYVGGSVGLSALESDKKTAIPDERHDLGGFGFIGGGFVGYNFCLPCCFDAGLEVFINGNTTKAKLFHYEDSTKLHVSSKYNWGVRALPG